jgi:hypothetical protein
MQSIDELRQLNINLEVARTALEQAHRRLSDANETKKAFEQKASTFFSAYVMLSVALFGVGGTVYKDDGFTQLVLAFLVAGIMFVIGALLFADALWDRAYGALGSDPEMWLRPGTIDGDERALALMHLYVTYYHRDRIAQSVQNNNVKATRIRQGIIIGALAPLLLGALLTLA